MMNEKFELPFQFKDAYNKLFKRITISLLNSLLSILLTILLFANDVINKQTPLFWGIVIVLGAMIVVSIIAIWNEHKNEEAYIYHELLQKTIENKELSKDRTDLLNITFETRELLMFAFNYLVISKSDKFTQTIKNKNIKDVKDILGKYFKEILFYKLPSFFGQVKDERFSMAIYLFDSEQNILWDFLSKKHPKINSKEDAGRNWKLNATSHIAFCFNHRCELIHSNIERRFSEFGLTSENTNEEDLENYKSAITLPIYFNNGNNRQIAGVFCLTSNNIGTFHELSEQITDPVYSIKITALRFIVETLSNNLELLYDNNVNNIKRIVDVTTSKHI